MRVLAELVAEARRRAEELPAPGPASRCRRASFLEALRGKRKLSVIAEFKRRSPSKGGIAELKNLEQQVRCYDRAGAAAISVLTEPTRFGGCAEDLSRAVAVSERPVLMKDFVVDPRQVRQAAALGASAVLLIVRCLTRGELLALAEEAGRLGLTPLIECHDERELGRALEIESAAIGVNNRDLDSLEIHLERAPALLAEVPLDRVAVAEIGYVTTGQLADVRGLADAVLVGTALMQSGDPKSFIKEATG
ncbi:MAG: indole-3-glycerol-phosphate synthase [Planctomycetota bacterium]